MDITRLHSIRRRWDVCNGNSFSWGKGSLSRRCLCAEWLPDWSVQETLEEILRKSSQIRDTWFAQRRNSGEISGKRSTGKDKGNVIPLDPYTQAHLQISYYCKSPALLISTFASWFFYNNWNDAEGSLCIFERKNQMAENYNQVKILLNTYSDLLVMRDGDAVMMLMPIDNLVWNQMRVYWNQYTSRNVQWRVGTESGWENNISFGR